MRVYLTESDIKWMTNQITRPNKTCWSPYRCRYLVRRGNQYGSTRQCDLLGVYLWDEYGTKRCDTTEFTRKLMEII